MSSQYKLKIGKVSIEPFKGHLRLRWTNLEKRYSLGVGTINKNNFKAAKAKAQMIDADLTFERFDPTLAKYSPKHALALEKQKQPLILPLHELWEKYKESNQDRISHSYQVKKWRLLDNLFRKISKTYYPNQKDIHLLFQEGLSHYSQTTLIELTVALSACLNWAAKKNYSADNPCSIIKQDLKKGLIKKTPQCFSKEEICSILDAFYQDRFFSPQSQYRHSFYAPYVHFLAMTGFRPEEAIALTWKDIYSQNQKHWIRVEKAYTHGKLNQKTKTGEVRDFPVNSQLSQLLDQIPKRDKKLILPSVKGGYIDQRNFSRRYWRPILQALVEEGSVSQYLSPYHLRHTFITNLIRQGCDIATVGKLAGNKPQTILNSYLSAMVDMEIPEFDF